MNTQAKLLAGFLFIGTLLLSGCATNTSTLTVDTSQLSTANKPEATETVFVQTVVDDRIFEPKTRDASIPSVNVKTEEQKDHAIGRKRNAFGKALGRIVLTEDQTVRTLVKAAVESALIDNGWKVVQSDKDVTAKTKVIDVRIVRFWSWVTPGFDFVSLWTKIEAKIPKAPATNEEVQIRGFHSLRFPFISDNEWNTSLQEAYKAFIDNAKRKLGKPKN
jgi:uncharacterized lipoprotein YajG